MNAKKPIEAGLKPAEPLALSSLVDVAPGSIVSRTILNRSVGTVTLFAFDADQGLSEHSTPFDALVQVLDGLLELSIGGERVDAGPGDIVIMPANVPHALRASKPSKMLLTMIRGLDPNIEKDI